MAKGILNGLARFGCLNLRIIVAALIAMKVKNIRKLVDLAAKLMSPGITKTKDKNIVKNIASQGVLRELWMEASLFGRERESAIPYITRDEPNRIRSAVLAVAKRAIKDKKIKAFFPKTIKAISARGASDSLSPFQPIILTAEIATAT